MLRRTINRGLERLGFRFSRVTEMHPLDCAIRRHQHSDFFFVQIGANDGKQFDPIGDYVRFFSWRGLLVEPVKDYFDELVDNYADCPGLAFVNAAIADYEGTVTIHRVDPQRKNLPKWHQGIASLDAKHHGRSGVPAEAMIAEEVPCLPLMELLAKHNVKSLDLLQVDAEGCDIQIIHSLDFGRLKPKIIHFEHRVNDGVHTRQELEQASGMLVAEGYKLFVNESDCLAFL